MSPIARVFTVINFALAVAALVFAGQFLGQEQDWKIKHDKKVESYEAKLKEKDGLLKEKDDLLRAKSDDYTRAHSREMNLESENKSLRERNKELKSEGISKDNVIAQKTDTMTKWSTMLGDYKTEISQLRDKEAEAKGARDTAENAKLALEQQVQGLEREIEKLTEKYEGSMTTIANLESKVEFQGLTLKRWQADFPDHKISGVEPNIAAKVMAVTPSSNLVTLSVGKDDGVMKGFTFDVFRGSSYKGRVTVVEVDDKLCVARITQAKAPITKGDSAKTNL